MAKKKKGKGKRKRPPARPPSGHRPAVAAPPSDDAPSPPAESSASAERRNRRQAQQERRRKAERRRRMKLYGIASLVVLVLVGLFAWRSINSRRAMQEFNRLAAAAGCTDLREFRTTQDDRKHLSAGAAYPEYETSPPTHGPHWAAWTPAGFYTEPFPKTVPPQANYSGPQTVVQAVHSLEHGYIVIWYRPDLPEDRAEALDDRFGDEDKVVVAPYPELERGVQLALTAWGRLQTCRVVDEDSLDAAERFVERFRESPKAPERFAG